MSGFTRRRAAQAGVAATVSALAFAALASVGAAVSPTSTPAASSQYEKKVTICHRTRSKKNPFVTIRVSRNAVPAHLRHGDRIGPCSTAKFTVCHKAKNGKTKTMKVRGAKAATRHMRHGDKLRACKSKQKGKKHKAEQHKQGKKDKGKKKGKPGKRG